MSSSMEFLGKPIDYWLTLKQRAETLQVEHLIQEIAELSSKLRFYERRIGEMFEFMQTTIELKGFEIRERNINSKHG